MLKILNIKRFLKSKITKGGLKITKGGLKITKGGLKITKGGLKITKGGLKKLTITKLKKCYS